MPYEVEADEVGMGLGVAVCIVACVLVIGLFGFSLFR